jgi:hypothetical protein
MIRPGRVTAVALVTALVSACATTTAPNGSNGKAAAPASTAVSAMPSPTPAVAGNGARTTPASGPAAAAVAAGAPSVPTPPGMPRPFAEVIRDAKRTDGLFPLWQKDDKTWIEIPESELEKPFFLAINMSRGIGEKRLFAGLMGNSWWGTGGEYVAQFRKAAGNVHMVARNTTFVAKAGTPEERAVRKSFSDSLLASAPVASQPHPERKSILVDANALLMTDIPRASNFIERMYRNSYQFDPRNSYIESAKTNDDRLVIDVTAHYAQPRIPVQPPGPAGQSGQFFPPPSVLEDPRSMFLGFLYTFSKLPEKPMAPRVADSRIGHFATAKVNFSDESRFNPVQFYVNRWRLEKKDPTAAISEPVKPITFWLGNEIPEKHREPIRQGILEWNKAFEKAGFKDAVVVKQQPDDADFDLGETQYSSIRWMPTATPAFGAIGPTQVDPRTGEILDADIGWDANMVRNVRSLKSEGVVTYQPMYDEATGHIHVEAMGSGDARLCSYRDHATREFGFALALLEARGELDPDSPEADKLVADFLKDVTMHEVGHTLGLRHNFRASTVATQEQLADRAYAEKHGLTGSVMEYTPVNLALKGEKQGAYFTPTLGAYDYWAIEYAYKPIAPEQEKAELAIIAGRSNEPQLAFATDEDISFSIDPLVNQGDMTDDPLAFFRRRVKLSQELWQRLEAREMPAGESYSVLRRRFLTGFNQLGMAMASAAKYIGGAEVVNDYSGSTRMPVTPVPAAKQREALATITDGLLKSDSFKVSTNFMRKLVSDRLERDALYMSNPQAISATVELALPDRVLAVQRDVLNRLMSPVVARRVIENTVRSDNGDVFSLSELYRNVQVSVWDEARRGVESDALRRNLQREHLRRMTAAVLGSSAGYPADARALMRRDARELRDWLTVAARKPKLSAETRAHYAEAAESLTEALKAPMVRSGV